MRDCDPQLRSWGYWGYGLSERPRSAEHDRAALSIDERVVEAGIKKHVAPVALDTSTEACVLRSVCAEAQDVEAIARTPAVDRRHGDDERLRAVSQQLRRCDVTGKPNRTGPVEPEVDPEASRVDSVDAGPRLVAHRGVQGPIEQQRVPDAEVRPELHSGLRLVRGQGVQRAIFRDRGSVAFERPEDEARAEADRDEEVVLDLERAPELERGVRNHEVVARRPALGHALEVAREQRPVDAAGGTVRLDQTTVAEALDGRAALVEAERHAQRIGRPPAE